MKEKKIFFRYNIACESYKKYMQIEVGYYLGKESYSYIKIKDSITNKLNKFIFPISKIMVESNPLLIKIGENIFSEKSIILKIKEKYIGKIEIKNIDKVYNDSFWQYKIFCLNANANGDIKILGEKLKFRYAKLHLDGNCLNDYITNKLYATSNNILDIKNKYAKSAICLCIADSLLNKKIFSCIMLDDIKYIFSNKKGAFIEEFKKYTKGKNKVIDMAIKQKNLLLKYRVKKDKILVAIYKSKLNKIDLIFKAKYGLPFVEF